MNNILPFSQIKEKRKFRSFIGQAAIVTAIFLVAALVLWVPGLAFSQKETPGESVTIPGLEIAGWGKVDEVRARFGLPAGAKSKVPAVLILHGSGGVDGRGAGYARSLQEAGIATLEITMFPPGSRPGPSVNLTMPHAAAALRWLAGQPNVNRERLGVMGFSWGGQMSVLMASEMVQERLGKDVPKPAAFASFYPVCTNMLRFLAYDQHPFYNAHTRMGSSPLLIYVGNRDDYEDGGGRCDALVATFPAAAREHTTVRYIEGATHGFDSDTPREFYDQAARGRRGATVHVVPSPKDTAEAHQAIASFFGKHLKP